MDYFNDVSLDESPTPQRADDFLAAVKLHFDNKGTPDADRVKLIVPKLKGHALATFKAFTNANGDTNNATTTTWAEFVKLFETLIPNDLAESNVIEKDYEKASQTGSAETFVKHYKSLVARIRANAESMTLHSDKTLRTRFVKRLKATTQLHFDRTKLDTLENAYAEAIRADTLVYSAMQQDKPSAPRSPFRTPAASRAGTPAPPPAILALLSALGAGDFDWSALQTKGSVPPSGPSSSLPATPGLSAVEKDHSVPPDGPVPTMTPDIRKWCERNNACFRCRTKNATHRSADCPRFQGIPDRANYRPRIAAIDGSDASSGNGE